MAITNPRVWDLSDEQQNRLEGWLSEFDRSWEAGRLPARVEQLPAGPLRFPALVEAVKIDLERNWQQGRHVSVESYLRDYPELGTADTVPGDLLQAEWEARQRDGDMAAMAKLTARFPRRAEELRQLPQPGPAAVETGLRTRTAVPGPPPPAHSAPGSLPEQFGRYRILKLLGKGGMGAVYLAHDTQLDRPVALKVPRFHDDGPEVLERFHREARAAALLHHPNICPVYDVGEIGGVHYLTMAYIEGQSLADRLKAGEPLPPREAADLVRQIALALEAAHRRGVIHRDLKPANVLLDADGKPVVTDFGLARRVDRQDAPLTQSGAPMGTPAYMPPEQVNGTPAAHGPGCDIYSLGVILYELLTGRKPFQGTVTEILLQITTQDPPRPSALRPGLNPQLEEIVMRAIAKKVEERYPNMGEFASALGDYLRQEGSRTEPVNRVAPYLDRPTPRPRRKPPVRWWHLAVAVTLVGGAAVLLTQIVIRYKDKDGNEKTTVINPAPGSTYHVTTPDGKTVRGVVPVQPPDKGQQPLPAKVVIGAPKELPKYWDVSPDGKTLARVFAQDVELWDTATGKLRKKPQAASERATSGAFSPDSRLLAVGSYRRVKVWDLEANEDLFEFKEPKDVVDWLVFSDGKHLAAVDYRAGAYRWDMTSGKTLSTVNLPRGLEGPWRVFPDRQVVVANGGRDGANQTLLNLSDFSTQDLRLTHVFASYKDVSIADDGKRLLVGDGDLVLLHDLERKKTDEVHHLHLAKVGMVSISSDGKLAASGSDDKTAVVWDLENNRERATLKGFEGSVRVRFSSDGKTLFAWSAEGKTVRRWDVAEGKELSLLSGHDGGVADVRIRDSGKVLVVLENDGKVTLYDMASLPK
jgi:serine/threonine protein kinase/WD40 repeat protein